MYWLKYPLALALFVFGLYLTYLAGSTPGDQFGWALFGGSFMGVSWWPLAMWPWERRR